MKQSMKVCLTLNREQTNVKVVFFLNDNQASEPKNEQD